MYLNFCRGILVRELYCIKYGGERQFDLTVPRLIANEEKKSVLFVWMRMVWSLLVTGCTFNEYYNLNFVKRKLKNQKTFLTTGSNLDAYNVFNDKRLYPLYINKDRFNETYADFISRDWIRLSIDKEQIYSFFRMHSNVIIKPCDGDSGKGIKIVHDSNSLSAAEIDDLICGNESGIAEELLYNHPKLNELNASSLNTMRIVTVRVGGAMEVLFAGIRFGAKGSEIDNISTGGYIAPIDVISGKICGHSHVKKTAQTENEETVDHIGFQMPMWEELNAFLYKLTAVVPQMRYMAWDIAITEKGFVAIEGNHSSGNTITQAHLGETEQGLRVKLNKWIERVKK